MENSVRGTSLSLRECARKAEKGEKDRRSAEPFLTIFLPCNLLTIHVRCTGTGWVGGLVGCPEEGNRSERQARSPDVLINIRTASAVVAAFSGNYRGKFVLTHKGS